MALTSTAPQPGRRIAARVRLLVVLLAGIGVGAALTTGLPGQLVGRTAAQDIVVPAGDDVRLEPVTVSPARSVDGSLRADEPGDAVAGFLIAEAAGELADAYGHLSAADQQQFFSAAGYVAAHADLLPPVLGHRVLGVEVDGSTATVTTEVDFRPSLDSVIGLVPGEAEITWTAVSENGGWAVELTSAEVEPRYPDDAQAADDVADWAEARQRCESAGDLEPGPLRGSTALADDLCDAPGAVRVGDVGTLSDVDGAPYLAAYGGDTGSWARVVKLDAPVALRAVVAPVGNRWVVIGILPGHRVAPAPPRAAPVPPSEGRRDS